MADGGKDGVGGIASGSFEIAAAEMGFGFHMPDHELGGGAASQLAQALGQQQLQFAELCWKNTSPVKTGNTGHAPSARIHLRLKVSKCA